MGLLVLHSALSRRLSNGIYAMKKLFLHIQSAYFIGIKGVGMTAFAQVLKAKGVSVSGSDTTEQFFTDHILQNLHILYTEGFDEKNIPDGVDVVVASPAYLGSDNPEIRAVEQRGIPLLSWHAGVAEFFNQAYGIAVCGTNGKSTTTAMLGFILEYAGYDPTVVVGSRVNAWQSNARVGSSKYFLIEADEYKDAFLHYYPAVVLITNIEYDHPDYFPTKESYKKSFDTFMGRAQKENVFHTPKTGKRFSLKMPGEYNQENARLAYAAASSLGVKDTVIEEALARFTGLARRFEYYGEYKGAMLYDDYAHHPTELTAFIQGVREKYSKEQLIVLFQPHTFSRTDALFDDFVESLSRADQVAILQTYGSAREVGDDVIGERLAHALQSKYFSSLSEATEYFRATLGASTVFATVGAGDGWQVVKALSQAKEQ